MKSVLFLIFFPTFLFAQSDIEKVLKSGEFNNQKNIFKIVA